MAKVTGVFLNGPTGNVLFYRRMGPNLVLCLNYSDVFSVDARDIFSIDA